jgi:hypothetical protein
VHNGYRDFDHELPALDGTGKVHGELPNINDLNRYSDEALEILCDELKQSVQTRIQTTSQVGDMFSDIQNRSHGQRQEAEQSLVRAIEKYLGK